MQGHRQHQEIMRTRDDTSLKQHLPCLGWQQHTNTPPVLRGVTMGMGSHGQNRGGCCGTQLPAKTWQVLLHWRVIRRHHYLYLPRQFLSPTLPYPALPLPLPLA